MSSLPKKFILIIELPRRIRKYENKPYNDVKVSQKTSLSHYIPYHTGHELFLTIVRKAYQLASVFLELIHFTIK